RGVPPAATALGRLLLDAGLPRVKFFALPEGGWEGQKKLWAEKPPDDVTARVWAEETARQLRAFLDRAAAEAPARAGAAAAAESLEAVLRAPRSARSGTRGARRCRCTRAPSSAASRPRRSPGGASRSPCRRSARGRYPSTGARRRPPPP